MRLIKKTIRRWIENPFQLQKTTLFIRERDRRDTLRERRLHAIRSSSSFGDYLESVSSATARNSREEWFYRSH